MVFKWNIERKVSASTRQRQSHRTRDLRHTELGRAPSEAQVCRAPWPGKHWGRVELDTGVGFCEVLVEGKGYRFCYLGNRC